MNMGYPYMICQIKIQKGSIYSVGKGSQPSKVTSFPIQHGYFLIALPVHLSTNAGRFISEMLSPHCSQAHLHYRNAPLWFVG